MEISKFLNFETSCLCEVCSECQMKKLSDFINHKRLEGRRNYMDYYNNFIEKQSKRPEDCCLFEKHQVFDMNASIPWSMKHHIRNCYNEWKNYINRGLEVGCIMSLGELQRVLYYEFGYAFRWEWGVISEPNLNTRTILFQNQMTGLYYAVLLTKKHTFNLKTLAGLKVNEHLNHKWQLDYLVEKRFLPKQLADFLLNLHKM